MIMKSGKGAVDVSESFQFTSLLSATYLIFAQVISYQCWGQNLFITEKRMLSCFPYSCYTSLLPCCMILTTSSSILWLFSRQSMAQPSLAGFAPQQPSPLPISSLDSEICQQLPWWDFDVSESLGKRYSRRHIKASFLCSFRNGHRYSTLPCLGLRSTNPFDQD